MNEKRHSENSHIDDFLPRPILVDVPQEEVERFWRTHPHTYQVLWKSDFLIFGDTPLLARPLEIMVQAASDSGYWCDCKYREGSRIRYFCYTLSGVGGFRDQSGSYRLPAGHGFLVETDDPNACYFYPPEATEPWRFLAFTFHGLQAHVMVRALLREHGAIFRLPPESPIIKRLLGYKIADYSHGRIHLVQMQLCEAIQLVTDLLLALLESRQSQDQPDHGNDLVRQAVARIVTHTEGDLRVGDVAQSLGVSREHLSRLFHRQLGKSLRTFMLEQKIRRACLLLKETDMPIKTVSDLLGYKAYSNFSESFEQVMRMTPRQFRRHGRLDPGSEFSAPMVSGDDRS